ncbi:MAG: hypothetical protein LBP34_07750, partial [Flavobacteriaceae bacterium]|nr:hypothetical protein [Flavobacteriaceae bacterium]
MKNKFFFLILLFYQAYAQEIPIVTNYDDGRAYTTIAVDNKNRIWAGTDKNGIFILDKEKNQTEFTHQNFPAESNISELTINSMAGDESGNIWVAHSGTQNLYNVYGGVERINTTTLSIQHLSPDRNAQGIPFLENDGIGTRNVQQVIADKNNNIWLAQKYHVMTSDPGTIQPGTFSYRKADAYTEKFKSVGTWKDVKEGKPDLILHFPAYTYKLPISKSHGTRNVTSITANGKYLYVAVEGYEVQDLQGNDKFLGPRILKYH